MNFPTLQTENEQLKQQLAQLNQHADSLEAILNSIKSTKARRLNFDHLLVK